MSKSVSVHLSPVEQEELAGAQARFQQAQERAAAADREVGTILRLLGERHDVDLIDRNNRIEMQGQTLVVHIGGSGPKPGEAPAATGGNRKSRRTTKSTARKAKSDPALN